MLDAGCGTGLVAKDLKSRGFQDIDGFDLSPEMIRKAEQHNIYRELQSGIDLNQLEKIPIDRAYDIALACGVYTLGHVRPDTLSLFSQILRPNDFLVVSVRDSYMQQSGFSATASCLLAKTGLEKIATLPQARYIAEEPASYWIFRQLSTPMTSTG